MLQMMKPMAYGKERPISNEEVCKGTASSSFRMSGNQSMQKRHLPNRTESKGESAIVVIFHVYIVVFYLSSILAI